MISLAYVVCGVGSYLQTGLYLTNRTRLIGVISGIAAVISSALYDFLVSAYGMLGAAWATVLSFVARLLSGATGVLDGLAPWNWTWAAWLPALAIATLLYLPFQWWTPVGATVSDPSETDRYCAAFPLIIWKWSGASPAETAAVLATEG